MAGSTLGPTPGGGLLAKKGAARPAMRRQSQIQQAGFGNSGAGGLAGWLTGAEDDCGWNDMGDGSAPNYGQGAAPPAMSRSAIGLTAMTGSPDSLYVNASPDDADWDEADSYDDDSADWNAPSTTWQPSQPANPVGAMQDRLQAATAVPAATAVAAPVAASAPAEQPLELDAQYEVPVGLFGSIRAAWARFVAMIVGRGPVTVLHLDPALREQLRSAAYREGLDEAEVAEKAIAKYLGNLSSKSVTSPSASGLWN